MMINVSSIEELITVMERKNVCHLSEIDNGGHLVLDNFGGMSILLDINGNSVFVQYYQETPIQLPLKIYNGKLGFRYGETNYLLNEFMRNNYGRNI